MTIFLLGLLVFFGAHLVTAFGRSFRERMITRIGARPYRGLYSLVSALGLALVVFGWSRADASVVFTPPEWGRHANYALTLVAFVLLAAAYLPKGRIAHAVKHPMLAGVKIWALGHLLANGEVRSVILFGAFLLYAAFDRIAVARRGAPVAAKGPWRNDAIALAVGAVLWALVYFFLHRYLAGVALR